MMNTPSLSMVGLDPTNQWFNLVECHEAFKSMNLCRQVWVVGSSPTMERLECILCC